MLTGFNPRCNSSHCCVVPCLKDGYLLLPSEPHPPTPPLVSIPGNQCNCSQFWNSGIAACHMGGIPQSVAFGNWLSPCIQCSRDMLKLWLVPVIASFCSWVILWGALSQRVSTLQASRAVCRCGLLRIKAVLTHRS